jgi:4-amino-4-deoxy-L-arabinose transferase-like glycosyltransferase
MSLKIKIIIFLLSFLASFFVGYINREYIKHINPDNKRLNNQSLIYNSTIWNNDNNWYLPQVENFFQGQGYIIDIKNEDTRVRRTPGYSIWYGIHYYFLGKEGAHKIIPITQSILYALAVLSLVISFYYLYEDKKISLFIFLVILITTPNVYGYTFYNITEAIHPAFLCFSFYFYSKWKKHNKYHYLYYSGVLTGIATLVRPTNGLFLLCLLLYFFISYLIEKNGFLDLIKKSTFIILGFFTVLSPWVLRNYLVKNEVIFLEKFYNEDPMGLGKKQLYMSKWLMCWTNPRPEKICNLLRDANMAGDTIEYKSVKQLVNGFPIEAFTGTNKDKLINIFIDMQKCFLNPNQNCENEVSNQFYLLKSSFVEESPFMYYITAPYFIRGKEFVFQSNSTMFGSLLSDVYLPSIWKKMVKSILYIINITLFLSFFIFTIFYLRKKIELTILWLFIFMSFIAIVNLVHIEARYLLASYPFMSILLGVVIIEIFRKLNILRKLK